MTSPATPDATSAPEVAVDTQAEEWTAALREVELDVDAAEELLEALHRGAEFSDEVTLPSWSAPQLSCPLPSDLVEHASSVLQRQLDVSRQLAEAIVQARVHHRALGKLDPAEHVPVFFDAAV